MAKKKKSKSKQARKEIQAKRANMSQEQLMVQAEEAMGAENYREALKMLKLALKNGGQTEAIHPRLFEAYLYRAKGLMANGMFKEARTTLTSAELYSEDVSKVSFETLLVCSQLFSLKKGVPFCQRLSGDEGFPKEVETHLAMRLFVERAWDTLSHLPDASPLRTDAGVIQKALPYMDTGAWDEALALLRRVEKSSPFSPVRIFCNAMAAFVKGDDRGLARSLSALPESFPLKKTVATLTAAAKNGDVVSGDVPEAHLSLFWEAGMEAQRLTAEIVRMIDAANLTGLAKPIKLLSMLISPESSEAYAQAILEMIWGQAGQNNLGLEKLTRLTESVLPKTVAKWTKQRALYFYGASPYTYADLYLQAIQAGVPEEGRRSLLQGMALVGLVKRLRVSGHYGADDVNGMRRLSKRLGVQIARGMSVNDVALTLLEKAVEVDPMNREAYVQIPELLLHQRSRPLQDRLVPLYQTMAETFPEDPTPGLALATLYYTNNAFRKAEKVLAEALKRAPYNTEVREKSALAYLISADKNIRKGKGEMASADLSRAREMKVPSVAPYLAVKSAYYAVAIDKVDVHDAVIRELVPLDVVAKLTGISLLLNDIGCSTVKNQYTLYTHLSSIFHRMKKQVSELTSEQARRLLQPNPQITFLYGGLLTCGMTLRDVPELLQRLSFGDFLVLMAPLANRNTFLEFSEEMKRRLKKAKGRERAALRFMACVIENLEDRTCDFRELTERAEALAPEDREVIRAACRKLSFFACEPLEEVLNTFEFERMGFSGFPFDFDDDDDWDDDDDDDWDDDDEDWDDDEPQWGAPFLNDPEVLFDAVMKDWSKPKQLEYIQMIEDLVQGQDLSGSSDAQIKKIRKVLDKIPLLGAAMKLGERLDSDMKRRFSREAHVLLFGKPQGKTGGKKR